MCYITFTTDCIRIWLVNQIPQSMNKQTEEVCRHALTYYHPKIEYVNLGFPNWKSGVTEILSHNVI